MRSLALGLGGALLLLSSGSARAQDEAPATPQEAAPVSTPEAAPASAPEAPPKPPPLPEEPRISGFQLGLRVGYVRALDASSGNALTYQTPALLPIVLDAGYRTSAHVYLGVTGQLALAARTDCSGATDTCSAKEYRLGGTFQYHFSPLRTFDPWFGIGSGYEVLHKSGPGADHLTRTGFVLFDAQLGGDFALGQGPRPPRLGPYVGLAMGAIGSESGVQYGLPVDRSPTHDHQWVTIGARGTFDL
jgi:hypothetical protein